MDYDFDEEEIEAEYGIEQRKYNKVYTALFSMVPGGGHMYLGLMKKGLQFMFLFFGVIMLTDLIYSARSFSVLAIVVWFYSFFDAYHTRKKLERGKIVEEDLFRELKFSDIKPKYIGAGLIILGTIVFVQQVIIQTFALGIFVIPNYVKAAILDAIFPILLIGIGIFILRHIKVKNKNSQD